MTTRDTPWRETGNTDAESFRKAVARTWDGKANSPMVVEADAVWEVTSRAGLSRMAVGVLWAERKNDSWRADYGLDSSFKNPFCMKASVNGGGGWARYASYRDAAIDWVARLTSATGPYARTTSLLSFFQTYAPSSDGNDPGRYADLVATEVDKLKLVSGGTTPVPTTNPYPRPVVYDVVADAPRFGLTSRQGQTIRDRNFPGREGLKPLAIVLHIQEGTTPSSLNWWLTGSGVQASSNIMAQRDGSLLRVVTDDNGPWTNGDVSAPSPRGQALVNRIGGRNPNLVSLTIEAEGYWQESAPAPQVQAICWMVTEWMGRHGLTLDDIYRHADFNSTTRGNCPGTYYAQVMSALKGSGTTPAEPPYWGDVPPEVVAAAFPQANPGQPWTEFWRKTYAGYGDYPPTKVVTVGETQWMLAGSDLWKRGADLKIVKV